MIWRTPLPAAVELYNIAQDPSEKNNVAAANPEKVAALQNRANDLAAVMVKPLLLTTEFGAMRERLSMPPSLPKEEMQFDGDSRSIPSLFAVTDEAQWTSAFRRSAT